MLAELLKSCPTLQPHGLQHARLRCPSPTPNLLKLMSLSRWCHPIISSSVASPPVHLTHSISIYCSELIPGKILWQTLSLKFLFSPLYSVSSLHFFRKLKPSCRFLASPAHWPGAYLQFTPYMIGFSNNGLSTPLPLIPSLKIWPFVCASPPFYFHPRYFHLKSFFSIEKIKRLILS